ncbi:nitroreductase family protein [Sediminicola arcticus]|jgi:nitroreductase|uniref:Putative NAD(P)H nitroreductase n=1 Tax=Sediminicola arcticus TaxID=1574308 RepID=A0ABV2SSP2_9FLAO
MDLKEIIKNRRSVMPVQYNTKPISKEQINQLLEAANWAPTHKKTEPWRFKVLHGVSQEKLGSFLAEKYKETEVKFSAFKYNKLQENPKKAGAIIAICMQRDPKESIPEWEEVAAVAMAVQNMWLTATDMGLGSYWSSPGLIKFMNEFFELESGETCLGFFYLGNFDVSTDERVPGPISNKTVWM